LQQKNVKLSITAIEIDKDNIADLKTLPKYKLILLQYPI
jgi:hypothetical protein